MTKATIAERTEAINDLRELLNPGETVYTVLRHVSKSGMYRAIDLYVMRNNEPRRISWSVGRIVGGYDVKHEAVKASGCGMDMGFHLVHSLSYALLGDYDCLGKGCPSSFHTGANYEVYGERHHDGYALNHRWL